MIETKAADGELAVKVVGHGRSRERVHRPDRIVERHTAQCFQIAPVNGGAGGSRVAVARRRADHVNVLFERTGPFGKLDAQGHGRTAGKEGDRLAHQGVADDRERQLVRARREIEREVPVGIALDQHRRWPDPHDNAGQRRTRPLIDNDAAHPIRLREGRGGERPDQRKNHEECGGHGARQSSRRASGIDVTSRGPACRIATTRYEWWTSRAALSSSGP